MTDKWQLKIAANDSLNDSHNKEERFIKLQYKINPLSQSAACAAKCLFAVMQYMKKNDFAPFDWENRQVHLGALLKRAESYLDEMFDKILK